MTVALIVVTILALVMYAEGALLATVLGGMAQQSTIKTIFMVLLWPFTLPVAGAMLYKKFSPMINEVKNNPFLRAMIQAQTQPAEPTTLFDALPSENTDTEEVSN